MAFMLNKCKELCREVKFFTGYAWSLGEWILSESIWGSQVIHADTSDTL